MIFQNYWNSIGYPLSIAKGYLVDSIAFPIVELLTWSALILCLAFAIELIQLIRRGKIHNRKLFYIKLIGPLLALVLAAGQGALPFSFAPSAWRRPLADVLPHALISEKEFEAHCKQAQNQLFTLIDAEMYATLNEAEAMAQCNKLLDSVLHRFQLNPGRTVTRIKHLGPLNTFFGLSYGGPALHDPLSSEVGIISSQNFPSSRLWRINAVCHEIAHAKGFSREMDAEILSYLALNHSIDPRFRFIAQTQFLIKSGNVFQVPEFLKVERDSILNIRKETQKKQWAVAAFKKILTKLGMINTGKKYGNRDLHEAWEPSHPFFSTVISADSAMDF